MNFLPIPVSVKPHIRNYLVALYGSDRIRVNNLDRDPIFQYITSKISRPTKAWRPSREKSISTVTFLVTEDMYARIGSVITQEQAAQFSCFMELMLRQEFYTFVYTQIAFGIEKKQAILAFIERYDLENVGLNYEALKKAFYRYELKNNQKIFGKIVPCVTEMSQGSDARSHRKYSQSPAAIRQRKSRARRKQMTKRFSQLLLKPAA